MTKANTKSNPRPAVAPDETLEAVFEAPTRESICRQVELGMGALARTWVETEKRYMADNGIAYSEGWDLPVIDGVQVESTGEEVIVNQHQGTCNWLVQSIPYSLENSIANQENKLRTAKYWLDKNIDAKAEGNGTQADVDRSANIKADAEYRLELLFIAFDHARVVYEDLTGSTYLTREEKAAAKRRSKATSARPSKVDERLARLRS
jgi:hypothetical protein